MSTPSVARNILIKMADKKLIWLEDELLSIGATPYKSELLEDRHKYLIRQSSKELIIYKSISPTHYNELYKFLKEQN